MSHSFWAALFFFCALCILPTSPRSSYYSSSYMGFPLFFFLGFSVYAGCSFLSWLLIMSSERFSLFLKDLDSSSLRLLNSYIFVLVITIIFSKYSNYFSSVVIFPLLTSSSTSTIAIYRKYCFNSFTASTVYSVFLSNWNLISGPYLNRNS